MRVLHLCPLWFRVATDSPGGIETLLPPLLAELKARGVENTVLACAGSDVAGRLVEIVDEPLADMLESGAAWEYGPYEQVVIEKAWKLAPDVDVVHSHLGWRGWLLEAHPATAGRTLHTHHNPVTPDMAWHVARHPDLRFSTVSRFQAEQLTALGAQSCAVVYNGLLFDRFPRPGAEKAGLVYLGRMEHSKGPDLAIRVAQQLGLPLTLAGPQVAGPAWFAEHIAPHLGETIRYVGVLGFDEKVELMRAAACVLVPTREEEAFGLVAVEAMACGTPVVALARGALPEIIEEGVTGFVADEEEALAGLVAPASALDAGRVRSRAAERFHISASATGYCGLYEEIISATTPPSAGRPAG